MRVTINEENVRHLLRDLRRRFNRDDLVTIAGVASFLASRMRDGNAGPMTREAAEARREHSVVLVGAAVDYIGALIQIIQRGEWSELFAPSLTLDIGTDGSQVPYAIPVAGATELGKAEFVDSYFAGKESYRQLASEILADD